MKVDFEYDKALQGMVADVLRCEKIMESEQEKVLGEIGKVIKKNTATALPKSNEAGPGYKHMRDDIKVTINGKRKKTGVTGVTVHGGKLTAYKWHMLDDGTRNPNGTVHTKALHFTQKAVEASAGDIDKIVDELIGRVVND